MNKAFSLLPLVFVFLLNASGLTLAQDEFPFDVQVKTEDGQKLQSISISYFYRSQDGRFERFRNVHQSKKNLGKPVKLPISTEKIVITSNGYAPAWIRINKPEPNKPVSRKVVLNKGVECRIKVVDPDGKPIRRATLMPKAIVDGDLEITWRSRGTYPKGEATFRFPKQTESASVRVMAQEYKQKSVELPSGGGPCEVTLEPYSVCSVEVKDHKGNPVANSKVHILMSGPKFTDRHRKGTRWRTDENGKFEIKFNPDQPYFACVLVESKNNRGVLTDVKPIAGKTIQFQLPEPRVIKFRINGDQSVLKGTSFEFTNGVRDSSRRQYVMTLPAFFDKDQRILTVPGVLDGWASLSLKGKKGNLFWSSEIQFEPDDVEIAIDLDQQKEHQRKFQIVFEHNKKRVSPKGKVTFYVRSRKSGGRTNQLILENGIANIEGKYNDAVNKIRVVNEGLIGYCIDGDVSIDQKLIPLERLSKEDVQTIVVPVVPAGRISGKIQSAEGKPFVGPVRFEYRRLDDDKKRVNGFKQSIYIRNGQLDLSPVPLGAKVTLRIGKFGDRMTRTFVVNEKFPRHKETIILPKTELASFQILLPDGKPAKGCTVAVYRKSDRSISSSGRTNSKGIREVALASDHKDDYVYSVLPKADFQRIFSVAIKPGANVEVTLKKGQRLSGRVTNQKGKPVPQMVVQAMNEDGKMVDSCVTNKDGAFELTRLPENPVKLQATHFRHDVKVELTKPIKPGPKKIELKAIDKRKMIAA